MYIKKIRFILYKQNGRYAVIPSQVAQAYIARQEKMSFL